MGTLLGMVALNAILVHFLFAADPENSAVGTMNLCKNVILFYLISKALKNYDDLRIMLWSLLVGVFYLAYEVIANAAGKYPKGRLERVLFHRLAVQAMAH